MMRNARAHYIRKNEQSRIPERFIILDCEALRERNKTGELQSWALACTTYIEFMRTGQIRTQNCRYSTPQELWHAISSFTRQKRRTVLYAHNLNYDLRISRALTELTSLGWKLSDMRLDGRGSWSRWTRDSATLMLCDSASIFPVTIQQLGAALGIAKLPLPSTDEREKLWRRCERDVEILSTGIISYLKWLRAGHAGNWQMTGASQSWAHYRHSWMTQRILIHDDQEAIQAERMAMHTGRCEAWRWGAVKRERLIEYDWQNSYPNIARQCDIPYALFGSTGSVSPNTLSGMWRRYSVLATVTVTTTEPIVPTSHDDRTIWPVGTFQTTLWDPELRLLYQRGCITHVHRAWLYRKGPILKDWADWLISSLYDTTDTVPPWLKLILKHWSRSLIGRFGMRYRQWEQFAIAPTSHIGTSILYDSDSGKESELMQIGNQVFILGEMTEPTDACPQITSYIMSEARAKMWRVIEKIGSQNVYYMDTDSLVVNSSGHVEIERNSGAADFIGLRSKAVYRTAYIYGPRSAIFGAKPTVSGLSKSAEKIEPHKWQGEVWRSCKESIKRGEHDTVAIALRNFTLRHNERRRAFCDGGRTVPYELPGYVPSAGYVRPKTRLERAILNGYPAMLSHSTPVKHGPRTDRPKANSNTV